MNAGLYAVQDSVSGVFHPPFVAPTPGTAERFILDMVMQAGHPYQMHPGDYFLWRVGEYDNTQGLVIPCVPERLLCLDQFKS